MEENRFKEIKEILSKETIEEKELKKIKKSELVEYILDIPSQTFNEILDLQSKVATSEESYLSLSTEYDSLKKTLDEKLESEKMLKVDYDQIIDVFQEYYNRSKSLSIVNGILVIIIIILILIIL